MPANILNIASGWLTFGIHIWNAIAIACLRFQNLSRHMNISAPHLSNQSQWWIRAAHLVGPSLIGWSISSKFQPSGSQPAILYHIPKMEKLFHVAAAKIRFIMRPTLISSKPFISKWIHLHWISPNLFFSCTGGILTNVTDHIIKHVKHMWQSNKSLDACLL